MQHPALARGIALSVSASILFALLSGYTRWLTPLSGLEIFAWRVIWTLPGIAVLIAWRRNGPQLRALAQRLRHEPILWLAVPAGAAMLGVQLWLFLWAPLHGLALEVSLGYFLLPLVMVMVGLFFYRERLDGWQWLAVVFAVVGVAHELRATGAFSWATLLVALGYPPYFMLRRWMRLDALSGFALELTLLLPVALAVLYWYGDNNAVVFRHWRYALLLPLLGVMSATALACYLSASRLLPLGLFGILGYVEPVLLFVVALTLLGEPFAAGAQWTYGPIWLAVLCTAVHSARALRRLAPRAPESS